MGIGIRKLKKKVSWPNTNISESASHFCKYKGNGKIYKGNLYPIFFWQNSGYLYSPERSSLRTWFLKSRRVERHPYWQNCMPRKLHGRWTIHAIWSKNGMRMQIFCACNFIKMGVLQLVWTSGIMSYEMRAWGRIKNHYFLRTRSDCIFLCIFWNFLCIYKNGWHFLKLSY